jgi:dihydropteroate synthase
MMGVLNTTPDSFSPASRVSGVDDALRRVDALLGGGAVLVDVGGESTRPGAMPIEPQEETSRVIPVIEAITRHHPDLPLSIDTVHASTAQHALDSGAAIINDVTAGRHDPALLQVAATSGAGLVLSHSRGAVGQLADVDPEGSEVDIAGLVARDLDAARAGALGAGNAADRIVLDPGFGFGKDARQNWRLLDSLETVVQLGSSVLVGVSRKRFLGTATDRPIDERDAATAAACALAWDRGARIFRVHNPAAVRDALAVAHAMTS